MAKSSAGELLRRILALMLALGGVICVLAWPVPNGVLIAALLLGIAAGWIFVLDDTFFSLLALVALMFSVELAAAKLSPRSSEHEPQAKLFGVGTALTVRSTVRWWLRRRASARS